MATDELPVLGWQHDGSYIATQRHGRKLIRALDQEYFKVNPEDGTYYEDDVLFLAFHVQGFSYLQLYPKSEGAALWLAINADLTDGFTPRS